PSPIVVALGHPNGTMTDDSSIPHPSFYWAAVGDADGDGHADIAGIARDPISGFTEAVTVLGDGAGGGVAVTTELRNAIIQGPLNLADYDGDGIVDLLGSGGVLRGLGAGHFAD